MAKHSAKPVDHVKEAVNNALLLPEAEVPILSNLSYALRSGILNLGQYGSIDLAWKMGLVGVATAASEEIKTVINKLIPLPSSQKA